MTEEGKNYTYRDLLDILSNLPEEKVSILSRTLDLNLILKVINAGEEATKVYKEKIQEGITNYIIASSVFDEVIQLLTETPNEDNKIKKIIGTYKELSENNKKKACLDLMNNKEFQKDVCNITIDASMKAVPELKWLYETLHIKENLMHLYNKEIGYITYTE